MAERAGIFDTDDPAIDLSSFTPKKSSKLEPAPETVRAVAEGSPFKSRDAVPTTSKSKQRRRRTGRNVQFNTKVTQNCKDGYYEVTDLHGFQSLGETLERALEALKRELKKQPRPQGVADSPVSAE